VEPLRVQVIATTEEGTRAALAEAGHLSAHLNPARIVVLVPRMASYLTPPGGPREDGLITEQYRDLISESGVAATVRVCVCRRLADVFRWMVSTRSVIVVGGRRRWWWATPAQQIARDLKKKGHRVVFAEVRRQTL
jgi:hypothetical protein